MYPGGLKRQGYTVFVAENGQQALFMLERCDGPVHLLLTDVIMPDINGRAIFFETLSNINQAPTLPPFENSGITFFRRYIPCMDHDHIMKEAVEDLDEGKAF